MSKETSFDKTIVNYLETKNLELVGSADGDCGAEVSHCQSPIEQLFLIALKDLLKNLPTFYPDMDYVIVPQHKITIGRRNFQTDFLLLINDFTKNIQFATAIECDGHEFHEKTKEQVRNDRSRERKFLKEGLEMIRFSGSEIYENPDNCAMEVWEIAKVRMGL